MPLVDEFRQSEEEGPLEKAINDQGWQAGWAMRAMRTVID